MDNRFKNKEGHILSSKMLIDMYEGMEGLAAALGTNLEVSNHNFARFWSKEDDEEA